MNERVRRMIREKERAWKKYLTDETYNYNGAQGEGKNDGYGKNKEEIFRKVLEKNQQKLHGNSNIVLWSADEFYYPITNKLNYIRRESGHILVKKEEI